MKAKNPVQILSALSLVFAQLSYLSASEVASDSVVNEDDENLVIVTSTRTKKPTNAIAGTVTILDQEQIEQQTIIADDLASVLENTVAGFGPSLRKMPGRGESFRGRNPLYVIDGVPQHNPLRDGQRDGHTIDIDFIERIEVIHGANSIQGIGATGGIVSMTTKTTKANSIWENQLKASVTTDDGFHGDGLGYKLSWIGGVNTGEYDVTTGVSYNQRGMFYDGQGDLVGLYATQGDIMDSGSRSLFAKVGYQLSQDQRIQLMVNDFNLERDHDFRAVNGDVDAGIPTTSEAGAPIDVGDPAQNEVTTVTLNFTDNNLSGGNFVTQFYQQDYAALFEGGFFGDYFRLTVDGDPFLDQSQIESKKMGLKFTQSWNDVGGVVGLNPTIGLDFQRDESAQILARSGREWVPVTDLKGTAPFVQLDYELSDSLRGTVGLRHENAEISVKDYITIAAANSAAVSGGSPDYSETLTNTGLIADISDSFRVYASFSEGFTMPDVGRVLRAVNTPGQDVDSIINLEPVVTENIEIGFDLLLEQINLHVAWYQSNSKLGSRLELNENDIFDVKREKTEIAGWEISGDSNLTESLVLGFNYTNLNGETDSDGDGSVDTDLDGLNIAPNRLNMFAEMDVNENLRARLQVASLFDRTFKSPTADTFKFEGFTTADLSLSQSSEYGVFSLGINNLFDKQYIAYLTQAQARKRADSYFSGVGRTLTIGYSIKF